jgi:hypothetical protein
MQNLLVSLKRILSEASLIKTSYNTNILVFAFVSYSLLNILIVDGNILPANDIATEYEPAVRKASAILEYA